MTASSQLATLAPGTLFAGRYRIHSLIATGGMGSVYLAEQPSTGAQRALKLLHRQFVDDARMRGRFEHEAHAEARIASDHVVRVIEAGIDEATDVPWIAMEFLEGEDLHAAIERRGAYSNEEVIEIMRQICDALAAAHDVGIVHRDLKPENIFMAVSRQRALPFVVKVLDFGIARVFAETRTTETAPLGTPLWMAPEQTAASANIGPAADVWALGLLAYRLLTGRYYWRGAQTKSPSLMGVMREIVVEPIADASARAAEQGFTGRLPNGFDAWFARCVNRDSAARFQHAAAAHEAFAALWSTGRPARKVVVKARSESMSPQPESMAMAMPVAPPRSWALPAALTIGALSLCLLGLALVTLRLHRPVTPDVVIGPQPKPVVNDSKPPAPPPVATATAPVPSRAETLRAQCESGMTASCDESGKLFEAAGERPADPTAAWKAYRKGCDLGARASCENGARLAKAAPAALALTVDDRRTIFRDACSQGAKAYCPPSLGDRCDKGDGEACVKAAAHAEQSGRQQVALRYYLKACTLHETGGCQVLLKLGVRLCKQGDADGCVLLGTLLVNGGAGIKDVALGVQLLKLGCAAGNEDACDLLQSSGT